MVYEFLEEGIVVYDGVEDCVRVEEVVGCSDEVGVGYVKDNGMGYVDMGLFLFGGGIGLDDVGKEEVRKVDGVGWVFGVGIRMGMGKEKEGWG